MVAQPAAGQGGSGWFLQEDSCLHCLYPFRQGAKAQPGEEGRDAEFIELLELLEFVELTPSS